MGLCESCDGIIDPRTNKKEKEKEELVVVVSADNKANDDGNNGNICNQDNHADVDTVNNDRSNVANVAVVIVNNINNGNNNSDMNDEGKIGNSSKDKHNNNNNVNNEGIVSHQGTNAETDSGSDANNAQQTQPNIEDSIHEIDDNIKNKQQSEQTVKVKDASMRAKCNDASKQSQSAYGNGTQSTQTVFGYIHSFEKADANSNSHSHSIPTAIASLIFKYYHICALVFSCNPTYIVMDEHQAEFRSRQPNADNPTAAPTRTIGCLVGMSPAPNPNPKATAHQNTNNKHRCDIRCVVQADTFMVVGVLSQSDAQLLIGKTGSAMFHGMHDTYFWDLSNSHRDRPTTINHSKHGRESTIESVNGGTVSGDLISIVLDLDAYTMHFEKNHKIACKRFQINSESVPYYFAMSWHDNNAHYRIECIE